MTESVEPSCLGKGDQNGQVVTVNGVIRHDLVETSVARCPDEVRRGVALTSALAVFGREVRIIKDLQSASLCLHEKEFSL